MGIVSGVFSDFLGVTFPRDNYLAGARDGVLAALPPSCFQESDGRVVDGIGRGVLTLGLKYGVGVLTVSGAFLASLRRTWSGLPGEPFTRCYFDELLSAIAQWPHRVTKLHATLDVVADGREVVTAVYDRACAGGVTLTRKTIPASQVSMVRRPALYGPGDTGTAYLGRRTRDVWLKVYDKRNELLDRREALEDGAPSLDGFFDPGPLTRFEVALGRKVGCTLRDVSDPASVFWHHVADVLPPPPGVAPWAPMGEGFSMPPPLERLPAEQLRLLLEHSADVARAVRLADKIGPNGRTLLASMLRKLVVPVAASEASSAVGA